jgi:transcriptional regulator with XRE-family HTH domain
MRDRWPTFERDVEMLRLRAREGLTFQEIADKTGVSLERVRQILSARFGLTWMPPAVEYRKRARKRGY